MAEVIPPKLVIWKCCLGQIPKALSVGISKIAVVWPTNDMMSCPLQTGLHSWGVLFLPYISSLEVLDASTISLFFLSIRLIRRYYSFYYNSGIFPMLLLAHSVLYNNKNTKYPLRNPRLSLFDFLQKMNTARNEFGVVCRRVFLAAFREAVCGETRDGRAGCQ